jgi:hypothetical protein
VAVAGVAQAVAALVALVLRVAPRALQVGPVVLVDLAGLAGPAVSVALAQQERPRQVQPSVPWTSSTACSIWVSIRTTS